MEEELVPGGEGESSSSGEPPITSKEAQINLALKGAITQFSRENIWLIVQLIIWGTLCTLLIIKGYCLIITDYSTPPKINNVYDTWEIYYHIIVRITLITGLFTLAAFVFKMFKTTMHIYQGNKHRLNVLKSMPAFLAASKAGKEEEIFVIILKTVIKSSNTGLIAKEGDSSNPLSIIEKLINKNLKSGE